MSVNVQPAAASQSGALARMLTDAFMDEPATVWMIPDPDTRRRALQPFFRSLVNSARRSGSVLTNAEATAATLWRLPGRLQPGGLDLLRSLPGMMGFVRAGGDRAKILSETLRQHQPADAYRWLQYVGVAPDQQRSGWGRAVILAGVAEAHATGQPVYVDTAKEANFDYYQHLGFEPIGELDIPDGGPHFWQLMWYPPR